MNPISFSNEASFRLFLAIADKIENNAGLLSIPLANIDRWIVNGIDAQHRLGQWREIISDAKKSDHGMSFLLDLLRDDGEKARHLKSYSPFPGILTTAELDDTACAFSH